jgi:hypothetical protein
VDRSDLLNDKPMRQLPLVDDADQPSRHRIRPNGAIGNAVDFHGSRQNLVTGDRAGNRNLLAPFFVRRPDDRQPRASPVTVLGSCKDGCALPRSPFDLMDY